jgi:co-chaperonin GroES (HSP10)
MIGDYATKPLQGDLLQKFRDQIMGVTPAQDPGPGKTDGGVGKTETNKSKPNKGKVISLVPPGKDAAPQECVGSQTRDRAKAGPGLVRKIADLTIFDQSKGKSESYAHAARVVIENHSKGESLLHLTSLK